MASFLYQGEWVEVPPVVTRLARLAALSEMREMVESLPDMDPMGGPWADTDCSCMEHYCYCEHRGKAQVIDAIDALMSDPSDKVTP